MKRSLLVAFILVVFFALLAKWLFTVRSIDVRGDENCLNKENVEANSNLLGKNIFLINTQQIEKNLKGKNSCLESISLSRRLPSKLVVSVKAKVPVAKIDGTDLLATVSGEVIKQQVTTNIPTIYLPGNVKATQGTKLESSNILSALGITAALLKSDFNPSSVRIVGPEDIAVYSTNETVALFTTRMSTASQVDSLQSILTKAKIDASKIAKLDLRFDKPIIIFK
jgi:cell division septal protein FtsQ